MKNSWKAYVSFSKKERIAVILLLFLIAFFIALPYFFHVSPEQPVIDPGLKAFVEKEKPDKDSSFTDKTAPLKPVLFRFDPNTLSPEGWIQLGLRRRTAQTIINYRNKGGRFRAPEDIRKIWGIAPKEADRLIPYVQLAEEARGSFYQKTDQKLNTQPVKADNIAIVDINTASPAEWKALPGIGEVLANRIVHYRERMNGFTGIDQVKKVYGISDSVFRIIQPFLQTNSATLKKLDLNRVSQLILAERTGISPEVARAIIVFRQQYGAYASVEDLRKIVFINDSLFARIRPYVVVE